MEIITFLLGGLFYGAVEILYRGYTHWSMVITGGAIVFTLYMLLPLLYNLNVFLSSLIGAGIITFYELSVGVIVNKILKLNVWDYSQIPGNIFGQICPTFSGVWFLICLAFFAIIKYNKYSLGGN